MAMGLGSTRKRLERERREHEYRAWYATLDDAAKAAEDARMDAEMRNLWHALLVCLVFLVLLSVYAIFMKP